MRAILACAGVTLMAAAALLAQQAPTFRSRVDTVDVHVTVRDANGRLVPDLAKDDFELFDNGKPVELAVFSADPQPIAMSILLDRSGSTENRSTQVLDAAEAFVGELRGDDRGALHTLSFECQPLTTEKARLYGMLRSPVPIDMGSPIWSGLDRTMTSMADAPGRRAILLFSDGEDTGPSMGSMIVNGTTLLTFPGQRPGLCHPWTTPSVATFDEALKRAQRDGVMVYTVGIQNANGRSNDGDLRTIAQKSGGDRYQLKDPAELTAAFKRIADELHHQYLLGFVPAVYDGKVHDLDVRVKRPGVGVRARKSYVADRGDAAPAHAAPVPPLTTAEIEDAIKRGAAGQKLQVSCRASAMIKNSEDESSAYADVTVEGPLGRIMRAAHEAHDRKLSFDASQVTESMRRLVVQVAAELKATPKTTDAPKTDDRSAPVPTTGAADPASPIPLSPAATPARPAPSPSRRLVSLSALLLRSKVQTEVVVQPEAEPPNALRFTAPSLTKVTSLFDLAAFRALPGADVEVVVRSGAGLRYCTIGAKDRTSIR